MEVLTPFVVQRIYKTQGSNIPSVERRAGDCVFFEPICEKNHFSVPKQASICLRPISHWL